MEKTIKYGTMIHANDNIYKYVIYKFDDLEQLKDFWLNKRTIEGQWEAYLDSLVIKYTTRVHSSEYFDYLEREEE